MPQIRIFRGDTVDDLDDQENFSRLFKPKSAKQVKVVQLYIDATINKMVNNSRSLDDIRDFVVLHWKTMNERSRMILKTSGDERIPDLVNVTLGKTAFGLQPNKSFKPRNGVTNWGGFDTDRPTGYLGFNGQLEINCKYHGDRMLFDHFAMFDETPFHITNSGWKYGIWTCHFQLFLSDWPAMEEQATTDRLMGTNPLIQEFYAGKDKATD